MAKSRGRKAYPADMLDPKIDKMKPEDIEKRKIIEKSINPDPKNTLKRPTFLSKIAKREWNRIMKLYEGMDKKILSDLDQTSLVMYCEAVATYKTYHSRYKELSKELEKLTPAKAVLDEYSQSKLDVRSSNIDALLAKIEVQTSRMNRQSKVVNNLAEQLCLTPVARAKIGVLTLQNIESSNPISSMFKE